MDTIDLETNVPSNVLLKGIYSVLQKIQENGISNSGSGGQYQFITDGTAIIRTGMRNGSWVKDQTLTMLGFAGVQNTDWICLEGE